MDKPTDVGEIVSQRDLEFRYDDGRKEKAIVKVGKPYEYNEDLDWICPYEISTESHKKVFGMVGIDSLQAMDLTLKTLKVEVDHFEKKYKGKFYFYDEIGSEI